MNSTLENIPVFILCGGVGTRLKEETEFRPKPMVPIGGKPLVWHIMSSYRRFGFKRFILCLGFKAEAVKEYFLNYHALSSDFTIDLKTGAKRTHLTHHPEDWEVTLADTGLEAMTGARIARAAKRYLTDEEHFAVTYGDGLTDANLAEEFAFHYEQQKLATVLGIHPPSRFGEMHAVKGVVTRFEEKPDFRDKRINGGYFFFRKEALSYLSDESSCILEQAPLKNLTADRELMMYPHDGFWACMDTLRDQKALEQLCREQNTPWLEQ